MAIQIHGAEGMDANQVRFEIQRGGRFVMYQYCISVIVITFRRSSDVFFVKAGENAVAKGLNYTLLTLLLGWWGIPFGPIFSVMCLWTNLKGGKDVTHALGY